MSSVEDINVDDSPESPVDSKDNALFEPKAQPKIIRVLTVLAYILSVSMAAILLSIYYIFMWNEHKTYALHNEFVPPGAASSLMEEANFTTPTFNTDQLPQIEMQQQITNVATNEVFSTPSSTEENTTSPGFGLSFDNDEFEKTSTFMKKIMYKYPYDEND
nr:PREDICTED: uncharacterized protein LOC103313833 isoform X2 [Tribolium castaneum]XP_015837207.1 PREDICTED: uncharacterized protein LOC103313833 isoform X2 [Tribolium castaneum]|eukprot:XP_008196321.2 PREDICTED: uncharacterized protein LOC103313833 isoform X2 [Tribolium castaneum]